MTVAKQLSLYEQAPLNAIMGPFEETEFITEEITVEEELLARAATYEPPQEDVSNVHYLPEPNVPPAAAEVVEVSENLELTSGIDGTREIETLERLVPLFNQLNRCRGQRYALDQKIMVPKSGSVKNAIESVDKKTHNLEVAAIEIFKDGFMRASQLRQAGFSEDEIEQASATMYAELLKNIGPGKAVNSEMREAFIKDFAKNREEHVDYSNVIPF